MSKDSLGDRMKTYEVVVNPYLVKRVPVMIRLDGKAFHSYAGPCKKPFSHALIEGMRYATVKVAEQIQGFKMAYVQSDEASFLVTDFDSLETQGYLDYRVSKILSHTASIMTANFNYFMLNLQTEEKIQKLAYFDSRCFNIPLEDVPNAFLWRMKDWVRNSLQMYTRNFYSHKDLLGKNLTTMHEMLHTKGKNWAKDLSSVEKNGSLFVRGIQSTVEECTDFSMTYQGIQAILEEALKPRE